MFLQEFSNETHSLLSYIIFDNVILPDSTIDCNTYILYEISKKSTLYLLEIVNPFLLYYNNLTTSTTQKSKEASFYFQDFDCYKNILTLID